MSELCCVATVRNFRLVRGNDQYFTAETFRNAVFIFLRNSLSTEDFRNSGAVSYRSQPRQKRRSGISIGCCAPKRLKAKSQK